jgi:sulfur relay (sulfurtransferase) DsrF/TusC family protein
MITKNNKSQEGIILIITSFNQLNNFLSFFLKNNLIDNKKIYLFIFSDTMPEYLISYLMAYIENFTNVEIVDMRRKSIKFKKNFFNIRLFNIFYYYFVVLKKIIQVKKKITISYISTYSKMQKPILFLISFFSSSKIFFIEDGLANYIPHNRNQKISESFFFKNFMMLNKSRIQIIQLAKSRLDYSGLFKQPFLSDTHYLDNREVYKKFIEQSLNKKLPYKPKCILIGTRHDPANFDYYKNLYIKTLFEIKKKYSYSSEQILFFLHPREETIYIEELIKCLSNYSNITTGSSVIVEDYLSQNNLETVIGAFSSSLIYAKSIFNKGHVYYINHFKKPNESNENNDK